MFVLSTELITKGKFKCSFLNSAFLRQVVYYTIQDGPNFQFVDEI